MGVVARLDRAIQYSTSVSDGVETQGHGVLDSPAGACHRAARCAGPVAGDDSLRVVRVRTHTPDSNFKQPRPRDLAAPFARVLLSTSRPLKSEGAGNAGRPLRPQPRVRNKKAHELVTTVTPDHPDIPRAMVYGLFRALPGDRALLPPSPALPHRRLDASVGASGPHGFAVRVCAARLRRIRVHCIPPQRS